MKYQAIRVPYSDESEWNGNLFRVFTQNSAPVSHNAKNVCKFRVGMVIANDSRG